MESSKYTVPLLNKTEYIDVPYEDRSDVSSEDHIYQQPQESHSRLIVFLLTITTVVSLSFNIAQAIGRQSNHSGDNSMPITKTGLSPIRDIERHALAPTRFSSENESEAREAWEAIEAGHGIVAVDLDWAHKQGLPQTAEHMFSEKPNTEVTYGIEGYHAIHCLKTIRRHYFNLKNNETPDRPLEHDLHCFDALRQHVMCHADDTLLAYKGPADLGTNQVRMCRSWDALRDWASERTACYKDWEPPEGESRWQHCDGGDDGLPYGSILE